MNLEREVSIHSLRNSISRTTPRSSLPQRLSDDSSSIKGGILKTSTSSSDLSIQQQQQLLLNRTSTLSSSSINKPPQSPTPSKSEAKLNRRKSFTISTTSEQPFNITDAPPIPKDHRVSVISNVSVTPWEFSPLFKSPSISSTSQRYMTGPPNESSPTSSTSPGYYAPNYNTIGTNLPSPLSKDVRSSQIKQNWPN